MTESHRVLPEFERPPVAEVAMAVQLAPLRGLRTPQLGLLWGAFRDRYPKHEEHVPLDPVMETFGAPPATSGMRVEILDKPQVPRCWFLNAEEDQLIQVQQDRFALNWRKRDTSGPYPRYSRIRAAYLKEWGVFRDLVIREQLGDIRPNQCEVTYVNHIEPGSVWTAWNEMPKVLTLAALEYSEPFLPDIEQLRLNCSYVMTAPNGAPIGRLRVIAEPATRRTDGVQIILLKLIARGAPIGELDTDGVMAFFDLGHEWIVRSFTALTTKEMHAVWGRMR